MIKRNVPTGPKEGPMMADFVTVTYGQTGAAVHNSLDARMALALRARNAHISG